MGVFLRWGVFGILAVAAMVYAYNALGHIADARKQAAAGPAPVTQSAAAPTSTEAPAAATPAKPVDDTPERCRVEIEIARRASESRSIGEPLDRLLRIQEIAWQEDAKRRERLTVIATDWFNRPGGIDAATQRAQVLSACLDFKP